MDFEKEARKAKRVNYIALGILAAVVLAVAAAAVVYRYKHTFSSEKWLNNPDGRTAIVDDLLEKYELVGMTEADVTALLGEHNNDYGYFNADNRYVYCMGLERGLISIDCEWLILDFADGRVSDVHITTD